MDPTLVTSMVTGYSPEACTAFFFFSWFAPCGAVAMLHLAALLVILAARVMSFVKKWTTAQRSFPAWVLVLLAAAVIGATNGVHRLVESRPLAATLAPKLYRDVLYMTLCVWILSIPIKVSFLYPRCCPRHSETSSYCKITIGHG